jgi:hypothetical protein
MVTKIVFNLTIFFGLSVYPFSIIAQHHPQLNIAALLAQQDDAPLQQRREQSAHSSPRMGYCSSCDKHDEIVKPFICEHKLCLQCNVDKARVECPTCEERGRVCAICLQQLPRIDDPRVTVLMCNHFFCKACLDMAIAVKNECAICRQAADPKTDHSCDACKKPFKNSDDISTLNCHFFESTFTLFATKAHHKFHDKCYLPHIKNSAHKDASGKICFTCPVHDKSEFYFPQGSGLIPIEGVGKTPEKNIIRSKTAADCKIVGQLCVKCKQAFVGQDEVTPLNCDFYKGLFSLERIRETHYFHDRCYNTHIVETRNNDTFPCPVHERSRFYVPTHVEVNA